jgi:hypothetical protein
MLFLFLFSFSHVYEDNGMGAALRVVRLTITGCVGDGSLLIGRRLWWDCAGKSQSEWHTGMDMGMGMGISGVSEGSARTLI